MKLSLYAFALCFLSSCLFAEEEIRDNTTGITFPSTVTFNHDGKHYTLHATGVATRKKFVVNIYSVASYLQDTAKESGDLVTEIMNDQYAKQLTMKWMRSVDAKRVQDGYQESFQKALSPEQFSRLQNDINHFIQFFSQDVQKGDEHVLRWIPEGTVEVLINGQQKGILQDKDFVRGLWSIWFGENSVVNRKNLVSLIKQPQ